jgi:hypothetical protein
MWFNEGIEEDRLRRRQPLGAGPDLNHGCSVSHRRTTTRAWLAVRGGVPHWVMRALRPDLKSQNG